MQYIPSNAATNQAQFLRQRQQYATAAAANSQAAVAAPAALNGQAAMAMGGPPLMMTPNASMGVGVMRPPQFHHPAAAYQTAATMRPVQMSAEAMQQQLYANLSGLQTQPQQHHVAQPDPLLTYQNQPGAAASGMSLEQTSPAPVPAMPAPQQMTQQLTSPSGMNMPAAQLQNRPDGFPYLAQMPAKHLLQQPPSQLVPAQAARPASHPQTMAEGDASAPFRPGNASVASGLHPPPPAMNPLFHRAAAMTGTPYFLQGMAVSRVIQYGEHLANCFLVNRSNGLEYWRHLIDEFFAEKGKMRITTTNGKNQAVKTFELDTKLLPRYYQQFFESEVRSIHILLENPKESMLTPHSCMVDSSKALMLYDFGNGVQITAQGHLRVAFNMQMKIERWEFISSKSTEYLSRDSLLSAAGKLESGEEVVGLPVSVVSAYGLPFPVLRCLEIGDVAYCLEELWDYSSRFGIGPLEALQRFAQAFTNAKARITAVASEAQSRGISPAMMKKQLAMVNGNMAVSPSGEFFMALPYAGSPQDSPMQQTTGTKSNGDVVAGSGNDLKSKKSRLTSPSPKIRKVKATAGRRRSSAQSAKDHPQK